MVGTSSVAPYSPGADHTWNLRFPRGRAHLTLLCPVKVDALKTVCTEDSLPLLGSGEIQPLTVFSPGRCQALTPLHLQWDTPSSLSFCSYLLVPLLLCSVGTKNRTRAPPAAQPRQCGEEKAASL